MNMKYIHNIRGTVKAIKSFSVVNSLFYKQNSS